MYEQLYHILPEVAMKETRSVVFTNENHFGITPGEYGLVELYCTDAKCDCKRVCFKIMSATIQDAVATIYYGWGSLDYYTDWFNMGRNTLHEMDEYDQESVYNMHGFHICELSPQTEIARPMLKFLEAYIRDNEDYANRLKQHYKLVRAKVEEC